MNRLFILSAAALALPVAAIAGHHEGDGAHKMAMAASPDALSAMFCDAVIAEDAGAATALYTDDAVSYGPGGDIVEGKDAIMATWEGFFGAFDDFTCGMTEHGSIENEDNAAKWGVWTMTATPAGGGDTVTWNGRFMDVAVKTDHGWKYKADHASMMAPQQEDAAEE